MVGWGRDGGIRQVKWFIVFILIKRQECQCARKLMRQVRESERVRVSS